MQIEQEYRFGQFRLLRSRRHLLENDRPVRLGSRALDLLTALLERAGDIVTKEDLIAYAWPTVVVEESSLRFHLWSLRKALGDGQQGSRFIANVSGRGYCFVGQVENVHRQPSVVAEPTQNVHNLPVRLTRMIGRADLTKRIAALLSQRRFVTIVGPGGMGKSTLAVAVCDELLAGYPDGAWLVDLTPLSDGQLVVGALANALGVTVSEVDPMRSLVAFLREKRILILLDNCEHVIDATAMLVEDLLSVGSGLHVLATSREPLGACGEWLQSLPPLDFPESSAELTAFEALQSSAVQLFVERAGASQDSFELHDWEAPSVAEICRRLDGMPLAIELAAAHVDAFGVMGLLAQMDDRFPLQYPGRRAGPRRHQTLRALLDWSFDLLSEADQMLLGRLAVFTGLFTMDAVHAVCLGPQSRGYEVALGIESLASKSLVLVVPKAGEMQYRLLDTTRSYALERLEAMHEQEAVRLRHAHYLCAMMTQAERDWTRLGRSAWISMYSPCVDDVRAVLDREFGTPEGTLASVRLTSLFYTVANALSFQAELLQRLEVAMQRYTDLGASEPQLEFRLCALISLSLNLANGPGARADALLARARMIADAMNAPQQQAQAMNQAFSIAMYVGDCTLAQRHADDLCQLASTCPDAAMALTADRARAQLQVLLGNLRDAKRLIERVLRSPALEMPAGPPYLMPNVVAMRILLARVLWLEGLPEQGLDVALQAHELCAEENLLSQGLVMSWALCPIALWSGDLDRARPAIENFKADALRYDFAHQLAYACEYERVLKFRERGSVDVPASEPAADGLRQVTDRGQLADFMGTMGDVFLSDEAVARLESGSAPWCAPEILRALGERERARAGGDGDEAAASFFERSLALARQHGALAWELRTSTSMARLLRDVGRPTQGRALLSEVFARFTEGFASADLVAAAELLAELSREPHPG